MALIDVNFKGLRDVKSELEKSGQKVTVHQADVSSEQSIIATRLDILNNHQHLDILVNNAGISICQHFEQIDLIDYKRALQIEYSLWSRDINALNR